MVKPETLKSGSEVAARTPVGRVLHLGRRGFWIVAILSLVIELASLAPIFYMWTAFDRVMPSRSFVTLVSLTLLVLGVYLFWSAIDWIRGRLLVRLSLRIDWELAADAFDASFRRHVGRRTNNVQQVMTDLLELRQFIGGRGAVALLSAPFALLFIAVGAVFHPYLAVFCLVSVVVTMLVAAITRKASATTLKASNNARSESLRLANSVVRQAEATMALGMMPTMRRRWYAQHREFLQLQVASSEMAGAGTAVTDFFKHAFQSLGLALGLFLFIEGVVTGGMVIVASMLVGRSMAPLQQLLGQWPNIIKAQLAYERLNALLDDEQNRLQQMSLPTPTGHLLVEAVAMVPAGAKKAVLNDVSFSIEAGSALAVVGPSASGKSSLAKLLIGVWRPSRGSVRLDGVEISDWNHDELGPHIGYVPQDIEFFEGTVAENIARLGQVDPIKVVEAAEKIGMHEIILSWPKGYDTMLGDSGFALSGGQKQRLAIARALYGDPKLVVFDEPNANLDDVGEKALVTALQHLRERKATVVITTHRPRLIGSVDHMLVLKGGRQVGFGAPKDLFDAVKRQFPNTNVAADAEGAAA